jgi:Ni,Fe-hydrogenase I cytochrome b subunit
MFDILSDRIKYDEHLQITSGERAVYWVTVALLSILFFGGLYIGIHLLP